MNPSFLARLGRLMKFGKLWFSRKGSRMIVRFYTSALSLRFINFMKGGKNPVLLAIRLVLFRKCNRMDKLDSVLFLFRINLYMAQDHGLIWSGKSAFLLRGYKHDCSSI